MKLKEEAKKYQKSWGNYEKTEESHHAFLAGATSNHVNERILLAKIELLETILKDDLDLNNLLTKLKEEHEKC